MGVTSKLNTCRLWMLCQNNKKSLQNKITRPTDRQSDPDALLL